MVEEEERVVGLVIAKPRSEYLDPSAPCTSPPMHRHLIVLAITVNVYHVCDGPLGLKHEEI